MADEKLEQLKKKYQPVLDEIRNNGVQLQNAHIQDGKLFLRAHGKTHGDTNLVWDQIKRVDPNYAQDLTPQLTFDQEGPPSKAAAKPAAAAPAARTYTVKAGDTLSKIAKQLLGDASDYPRIFEANRDQLKDPDQIRPGQVLKIPA